jgi:hypothetical protein
MGLTGIPVATDSRPAQSCAHSRCEWME